MGFLDTLQKESSYSGASGLSYHYVVLQVTLKEKLGAVGVTPLSLRPSATS